MPDWSSSRYTALSCSAGLITILCANTVASLIGVSVLPTLERITPVLFEIGYLILAAGVLAVSCWSNGVARMGALNSCCL